MTGIVVNMLTSSVILLLLLTILQDHIPKRPLYTIFLVYFEFLLIVELPQIHAQLQSPTYLIALLVLILGLLLLIVLLLVSPPQDIHFPLLDKLTASTGIFTGLYSLGFVVPPIRKPLIEIVTFHTQTTLEAVGYQTEIQTGPDYGYLSQLVYVSDGVTYTTYIELACTGLGATAVIGGLLYMLDLSRIQKIALFFLSASVIYILNIIRNVFIAVAFFSEVFSNLPFTASQTQSEALVSFTIAEVYISQVVSTILLFIILQKVYQKTTVFSQIEQDIQEFVSSLKSS